MKRKNCNGYESMFTFLNEEDFQKHLQECEECRLEHARMQKVSELIQEAKPYIQKSKKKKTALKVACAAFAVISMSACFQFFATTGLYDEIAYSNTPTIEEMGLPVDEYGFLLVD